MHRLLYCLFLLLLLLACQPEDAPDFNTEVRPILNRSCLPCHGGVKQSGDISFLFRELALTEGRSGKPCIVPGHPERSELMARITTARGERFMPLEGDPLSEAEIDVIRRWIKAGARWDLPWSYQPVAAVTPPDPEGLPADWQAPVDRFLYAKMRQRGLTPNAEAAPHRLIRRLSLDLTGLPPRPEWVDAYRESPDEATYQSIVDTLLASPHFGERWAAPWLDLSRYADSKGYERDPHRDIWRYRDWLINAINRDMPYDSFVVRQLAGDLLPQADRADFAATAFHRNTMSNDEGGTDNEEFRVQAVMDRVNTTWTVFLGTTMNCVQCHAHPYDPLRHEDYYTSFAVFNNDTDEDTHHDSPVLNYFPQPDSNRIEELMDFIESKVTQKAAISAPSAPAIDYTRSLLFRTPYYYHPHFFDEREEVGHVDAKFLEFRPGARARLPGVVLPTDGGFLFTENRRSVPAGRIEIRLGQADGPLLTTIQGDDDYHYRHKMTAIPPLDSVEGWTSAPTYDLWFVHTNPEEGSSLTFTWFSFLERPTGLDAIQSQEWANQLAALYDSPHRNTLPVMTESVAGRGRTSRLHIRGNRLTPGDTVQPGVPATLALPEAAPIGNRLDFANWITHPDHPLTARVAVNRYWAALFGTGIVETEEDFGSQGAPPTHPELLDYLAREFVETEAWSPKRLLRRLVSTAAYRQSAQLDSLSLADDPYNRYLSVGPRKRLTAEQLRDQALALSGLLRDTIGGPSVMPPQPEGVWKVIYSSKRWETTEADLHRRGLYTYWRRTSPYPSMEAFDGSSREVCTVRRITTNTPLQALVTLNDPAYLEVAAALTRNQLGESEVAPALLVGELFSTLLFRPPLPGELSAITTLFEEARAYYLEHAEEAEQLLAPAHPLAVALPLPPEPEERARAAALFTVTNTLMNLDEVLTM